MGVNLVFATKDYNEAEYGGMKNYERERKCVKLYAV